MSFLEFLASYRNDILPYFLFGGAFLVAIVGIIAGSVVSSVKSRAREQSRREIAAYIAEGSMSAEQGERLLAAKDTSD